METPFRFPRICASLGFVLILFALLQWPVAAEDSTENLRIARWRASANLGDADAMFWLGTAYDKGDGISKNDTSAVYWWRKAAEKGDARAMFCLGSACLNGRGVARDETHAVDWWRQAAEKGQVNAMFNLARAYSAGTGGQKDEARAVEWWRKAAGLGHANAMFSLGAALLEGKGAPRDEAAALEWLNKAARLGNRFATDKLANLKAATPHGETPSAPPAPAAPAAVASTETPQPYPPPGPAAPPPPPNPPAPVTVQPASVAAPPAEGIRPVAQPVVHANPPVAPATPVVAVVPPPPPVEQSAPAPHSQVAAVPPAPATPPTPAEPPPLVVVQPETHDTIRSTAPAAPRPPAPPAPESIAVKPVFVTPPPAPPAPVATPIASTASVAPVIPVSPTPITADLPRPAPAPAATPATPSVRRTDTQGRADAPFVVERLDLMLMPIPAGSFAMGSAVGGAEGERPVTRVTITRPFWLGRTEVTRGQWKRLMGRDPSEWQNEGGDDRPVEAVSWLDAIDFCKRLTEEMRSELPAGYAFTLPTEAEWEYACRAGTTGEYAGNLDALAWYGAKNPAPDAKGPQPVARKQANAWGLHDMHGNVAEWCLDITEFSGGTLTDPLFYSITRVVLKAQRDAGRKAKNQEVHCAAVRGGAWDSSAAACRSASRESESDYGAYSGTVGFRIALAPARDPLTAKKVVHTYKPE